MYTTGHTQQQAQHISCKLYELTRPQGVRAPSDNTLYLLPFFKHPERDEWAIEIIEDIQIPISDEAQIDSLMALYGPMMTKEEREKVLNLIEDAKTVPLATFFPAALRERLKTKEQLQADGWFAEMYPKNLKETEMFT